MDTFQKRMSNFEEELQKSSGVSASNTAIEVEYKSFKAFVMQALTSLQKQVELLSNNIDRLETRSRRKILLVHGLPESANENVTRSVTEVIQSRLKINECTVSDIKRCHRMGRPTAPHKPRPILVKFHDVVLRDKTWFNKTKLKGSGITLSEFLTKARHEVFMAAREKFGVTNCWTKEGSVYIIEPDGSQHRATNMSDVHKLKASTSDPKTASIKRPTIEKPIVRSKRCNAKRK